MSKAKMWTFRRNPNISLSEAICKFVKFLYEFTTILCLYANWTCPSPIEFISKWFSFFPPQNCCGRRCPSSSSCSYCCGYCGLLSFLWATNCFGKLPSVHNFLFHHFVGVACGQTDDDLSNSPTLPGATLVRFRQELQNGWNGRAEM